MVTISPFGNLAYNSLSYFGSARPGTDIAVDEASQEVEETPPQPGGYGDALQFSEDAIDPDAIDDGTYKVDLPTLAAGKLEEPPASGDDAGTLVDEFRDWADMTPAERIRAQYLSDHDLTEASLLSMDEASRNKILEQIDKEIEKQLVLQPTRHAVADLMQMLGVDPSTPLPISSDY